MIFTIQAVWLKIYDIHITCKVSNKCLDVRERVGVVEWNKIWSPPFPCCPVSCQCPWKKTLIEKNITITHISSACQDAICLHYGKYIIGRLDLVEMVHIPINIWCFKCFICRDYSDKHCIFFVIENVFLVYKFSEFEVEFIPSIRNNTDIIFSLKKHSYYCDFR